LTWWNVTHPETMILRKMSGPKLFYNRVCGPLTKTMETPGL